MPVLEGKKDMRLNKTDIPSMRCETIPRDQVLWIGHEEGQSNYPNLPDWNRRADIGARLPPVCVSLGCSSPYNRTSLPVVIYNVKCRSCISIKKGRVMLDRNKTEGQWIDITIGSNVVCHGLHSVAYSHITESRVSGQWSWDHEELIHTCISDTRPCPRPESAHTSKFII